MFLKRSLNFPQIPLKRSRVTSLFYLLPTGRIRERHDRGLVGRNAGSGAGRSSNYRRGALMDEIVLNIAEYGATGIRHTCALTQIEDSLNGTAAVDHGCQQLTTQPAL
jgi:hypothetical protein